MVNPLRYFFDIRFILGSTHIS
ncbi:hypothetical protein CY0110_16582 [Crocosphaera chwakensis CCY0110]|uniref:Uncharacterized protein n=1 Tax=Crocosphaera chwakensis CCY0110 TaxID=391612 RepID=A3IHZ8_9CHRO|nr:hypothetical protein CY0110_16582 [Crocosphaera chwakensis CCY0110]